MKVLVSEKLSEHKYKTPEGYLICTDAILARTGKQSYTKDELFQDGDNTEVNVDRPYDEVMNAKTIASFENKPITFDHPDEDVNVGNYKDYAIGYVRDVRQGKTDKGEDVILGNLVITDQDAINAIEQGDHTDLSCGYDCDIRDDGNGNYSQTNIRGNHLALCEQGRAGIAKIVDSKVKDAAIGGHYKNNRGENFFICSYGSGFSIFKANGEYLDGSKHLSLDGVKQRILYYNLTKVKDSAKDSIMKDESEDWTEMLIKLAVKNGKNSSGDYEYDGDADVNQVRRVLKKLGYKDNGYVKNPKSYLHKLHYYFTDSKVEDEMNYSEEMKAVRNALRHIVVDNKSEMKQLIQDLIDNKPMNYSLEVRRLKRAIDELIKWSDNRQEGIDTIWAIAKENKIVDSKVEDDNLLGKKVRIRKRYSNLDGTIGTIYSYEGTNYDDEVEVKRNGHIYKVNYEDIEFLDSKVEDVNYSEKEIKEAAMKLLKQKPFLTYEEALQKVKENIRNGNYLLDDEIEDAGWKTTKMASGIIHELGNMRIIEEENEKGDIQYRIGGTNGQVFSSLEKAKNAIRRKHLDEIEDSKEMTMSDAIKMLNIVNIYKKVKDSYIVVRNKSKYEDAARKLGLTIEKDNKSLRIYGDKYKLKQLQNQFDNDEEISYVVAKDSISKVDLKRGIDIAEDKYGYFDFSQLKEEIEKTTKHQFSTRELYEALKQNSLLNAYINRLFGNIKDEDLTKDGRLWQTLTRKAKH